MTRYIQEAPRIAAEGSSMVVATDPDYSNLAVLAGLFVLAVAIRCCLNAYVRAVLRRDGLELRR